MSQTQKLYELLSDEKPHITLEIMEVVYGSKHLGICRIASRISDLKKDGHNIIGWKDKNNKTLY